MKVSIEALAGQGVNLLLTQTDKCGGRSGRGTAPRRAKPGYQSQRVYYIKTDIALSPVEDIWSSASRWPFHFVTIHLYLQKNNGECQQSVDAVECK